MIDPDARDFSDWADSNARPFKGYSSAVENFQASIGQVFDEELSISSKFDPNREFKSPFTEPLEWIDSLRETQDTRRADQISGLIDDGTIDATVLDFFSERSPRGGTAYDWNDIAEYVNENYDLGYKLQTDEMMEKANINILAERRKYREDIFARSRTGGKAAAFAGGFVAGGLDPVAVATMPLAAPLAGVKATSRAVYTASIAGRSATLNMALQAPIEPFVHAWKEKIGAEYTVLDSIFNIGAAGLLGGVVSGTAANLGYKYTGKSFLNKDRDSLYVSFKKLGMTDDEADTLATYQSEINNAPDKNMPTEEYVKNLEETQQRVSTEGKEAVHVEPKIDNESEDLIEVMYNEVDNELVYNLDDGSTINVKQASGQLNEDLERIDKILGCLSGK